QLKCLFPDACLKLTQIRDHLVVEGQARDTSQVGRIMETINAYMDSVSTGELRKVTERQRGTQPGAPRPEPQPVVPANPDQPALPAVAGPEQSGVNFQPKVAKPV